MGKDHDGYYHPSNRAWRREGDRFVLVGVFGPDETFVSALLGGQTVNVEEVFKAQ